MEVPTGYQQRTSAAPMLHPCITFTLPLQRCSTGAALLQHSTGAALKYRCSASAEPLLNPHAHCREPARSDVGAPNLDPGSLDGAREGSRAAPRRDTPRYRPLSKREREGVCVSVCVSAPPLRDHSRGVRQRRARAALGRLPRPPDGGVGEGEKAGRGGDLHGAAPALSARARWADPGARREGLELGRPRCSCVL